MRKFVQLKRYIYYLIARHTLLFCAVFLALLIGSIYFAGKSPPLPGHLPLGTTPVPSQGKSAKPFGLALGDTTPRLSSEQLDQVFTTSQRAGVGWIRIDVSWANVQPQDAAHYNWSALDRVITAAQAHGMHVLATLSYTPPWARTAGCLASQKCAPTSDTAFAAFAAAASKQFAPEGVHAWEIWNEPNNVGFWQPAPSPVAYTSLLRASYVAIKQIDPAAVVISGGLGPLDSKPSSIDQLTFLAGVYANGGKQYMDAVGYHPYSYPAPPSYVANWSGWSTMSSLQTSVRSIMTANNDSAKQVWITEFGAPTNGPGAQATSSNYNFKAHPNHVDEALQATMLAEATTYYKMTPWLGNFFWYSYQDLGTSTSTNENFFGLLRYDGSPKPAYTVFQAATGG